MKVAAYLMGGFVVGFIVLIVSQILLFKPKEVNYAKPTTTVSAATATALHSQPDTKHVGGKRH
jgi:hypothetical protein